MPNREKLKTRLQAVISETTDEMLEPLMQILTQMDFDIVAPPSAGLLMMNIKESDETVFHLGEVLVTQAQVQKNGCNGYGCCLGDRPMAALIIAGLDALDTAKNSFAEENQIKPQIDRICRTVSEQKNQEARLAALTKVDFHSMAEEA